MCASICTSIFVETLRFDIDHDDNSNNAMNNAAAAAASTTTTTNTTTISPMTVYEPFKYEAQTALFKDPVRTAQ